MSAAAPLQIPSRLAWRLLFLVLPLLGAGYQIAAKSAAIGLPAGGFSLPWLAALAHSPWAWAMLTFEAASFVTWMSILARIKLSEAFPLSAVSYVLIIAAGWLIFHEPPRRLEAVGGGAILAGVWLIGSNRGAE
jgi:multidrug transporter EmrE-like cation transporter